MVLALHATLADRIADCLARYERGCLSIDRTLWLIRSSRAILDRGRPVISGGGPEASGGGLEALSESVIRTRLRTLIDAGVLSPARLGGLWEWTCRQRHPCRGCGVGITRGEIEVEISTGGGVVLFLHRHCFELWAQETDASSGASAHPKPERRRHLA